MTAPDGVKTLDVTPVPSETARTEPLAWFGADVTGGESLGVEYAPGTKHLTYR